eukprot:CAMPEP_0185189456 /NCGR_PEP_ID=MMETSP1140-20130426/6047_1 /TAXON_ID=298111 /ORGANISM="Pavlova sp., Strain CCMP459" /LENGTH=89 /DNA_ID=CAMNT_0027756017 /DNA_START=222 /DNA_END=487 /DNA_ORIENTATION=-
MAAAHSKARRRGAIALAAVMLVAVALLAMVTWGSRAGGPFTIALRGSGASVRPIEGDAPRHKRWLVFTRERSGTRWLMNTMVDRGAGRV